MTVAATDAMVRLSTGLRRSPGKIMVLLVSLWFVSNGPIAYWICPSFSFGSHMMSCTRMLFGVIPLTVNGWHAAFHLLTGLGGVSAAWQLRSAYWYGLGCGWFYVLAAMGGFAGKDNVLHFMAVDTFGNCVHAVEGALMLTAAALTASVKIRPAAYHRPSGILETAADPFD